MSTDCQTFGLCPMKKIIFLFIVFLSLHNLSHAQTLQAFLAKVPTHPSTYEKARDLCKPDGVSLYLSIRDEIELEQERLGKIVDESELADDSDEEKEFNIKSIDIEKLTKRAYDAEVAVTGMAKYQEGADINSSYVKAVNEYHKVLEQEQKKLELKFDQLDGEMQSRIKKCEAARAGAGRGEGYVMLCYDEIRKEMKPKYISAYNKYLASMNIVLVEYREKIKSRLLEAENIISQSASPQRSQGVAIREAMVKSVALEEFAAFVHSSEEATCSSISRIWK